MNNKARQRLPFSVRSLLLVVVTGFFNNTWGWRNFDNKYPELIQAIRSMFPDDSTIQELR